jgi:predicted nucleotidyltransferase
LYGSAASGESYGKRSDINVMVVLRDGSLGAIARSSPVLTGRKFGPVEAVFFTEAYIKSSADVFPIEFLDMKENYKVIYGKDVLKDLPIDRRNLRFQCEQELKSRLIAVKKAYPKMIAGRAAQTMLFRTFTSFLHISRNLLKLKGETPPYSKQDLVEHVAKRFGIDAALLDRILDAKRRGARLSTKEADGLLCAFTDQLERLADEVDRS